VVCLGGHAVCKLIPTADKLKEYVSGSGILIPTQLRLNKAKFDLEIDVNEVLAACVSTGLQPLDKVSVQNATHEPC